MTTEKQRQANRRNALKSSGPRTAAGKARSSQNAQTHGIFAQGIVTSIEDKDEFVTLITRLYELLNPQSVLEEQLVDQLAVAFWRARRLANAERMAIEENEFATAGPEPRLRDGQIDSFRVQQNNLMARLAMDKMFLFGRYQVMITNQIKILLEMIRNEQDFRVETIDNAASEEANVEHGEEANLQNNDAAKETATNYDNTAADKKSVPRIRRPER